MSFCYFAAATLLIYGAEDVEELADAFEFGVAGSGVHFGEGNFGKAGGGGKVSREAEGAHTAAVGLEALILERRCSRAGAGRGTGSC